MAKTEKDKQLWVHGQVSRLKNNISAGYQISGHEALRMIMNSVMLEVELDGEVSGGKRIIKQLEIQKKADEKAAKEAKRAQRKNERILASALRAVK